MTLLPSPSLVSQGFSPRVVGPSRIAYRQGEVEILPLEKGLPLVVGEAPGQREDETGVGFHPEAEAGGLLTRLLQRVGVDRARLNFINVVQQRPPHNELYGAEGAILPWTYEAIEYWKPSLHAAIEELQPPVIIGLGRTALETLTGFQDIGTTRGYVCEARIDIAKDGTGIDFNDLWERHSLHIPTISTYHPAFLNRGQHHLDGVFLRDVLAALEIGEKGWEPPELRVTPTPSAEQFRWFCDQFNPDVHKLTSDIETPNSRGLDEDTMEEALAREKVQLEIDRMSFCYSSEIGGYSISFEEPFLALARSLIRRAKVLRGWNWRLFDWPRLLQHGFATTAREYDGLDQWRHLHRTLPASVAFVAPFYLSMSPYKHEAHSQPEYYSAMDAIVTHEIMEGMEREMRATGQWETYQRHVVEIISTNHGICTQMARNGLPIDAGKVSAFEAELKVKKQHRTERLSQLVPDSVKVHDPKSGYKTLPKAIKEMIAAENFRGCVLKKAKEGKKEHWYTLVEQLFHVPYVKCSKAEKSGGEAEIVHCLRWVKRFDFLTSSPPQVKALFKYYGHKPKTDRKTKEDTTGDDTLKSLIGKYVESRKESDQQAVECYRLIRECRAIDKVLGTYVKGWKPASDGLIHATPGIWGDMFRISWRKPNLTATIADKKEMQIAAGFRTCICVPDDDVIIEADWKSQEAVLLAYYAKDPDYMRLALLGLNAYFCSHLLNRPADLSWSDADLGHYLHEIKHDPSNTKIYDDAKHCIYLVQNGGTEYLMAEMYEMTRARSKYLIDFYYGLFPKIKRFQQETLKQAHDKCRLKNAWNYTMPFWSVFQWQQKRFERLRQLWVRFKTARNEPTLVVWTKTEQMWLHKIQNATDSGHVSDHDAIASLCYDLGDDAKAALSFFPRDSGSGMLKDALLAMEYEYQLASRGILRGCIHDATLSICKRKEADEVAGIMKSVMERPLTQLDGLVIPVEVSIGQSWSKKAMQEWKGLEVHAM